MNKPAVYVTLSQFCKHDDRPRQMLIDAGYDIRENKTGRRLQRDQLVATLSDVDAVIAGVEPYDQDILESLTDLRCISRCGVGTDAIDLDVANRLGIRVLTTDDEVVEPVAEMTVAMIFALARNLPLHWENFYLHQWSKHTGVLLSEWTIGLIGFGRIGRRVEALLRPFNAKILVSDPAINLPELSGDIEVCDLRKLLSEADLVSLHAGRRKVDGPLIGRKEFSMMKKGSRLVNTSRGYLVDEAAMIEALEEGHLAGIAVDVFEDEPYDGSLMGMPQVLCTPHVATLTKSSRVAMELRSVQNLVSFLSNSPMSSL